ncbi:MAG: zf-HC2 domain-containing protein [Candidatus Obscuribacter sp.]|nr:zf-HC2 domain-containing protein [Candidatus Obscuribacter sp.]
MDISNSTCSEMEQALDAYLDLELEPEAAQAVEHHLEACPACALRLKELEALVERLQSLPAPALSRDLADVIGDRILAQKTTPTSVESSGQVVDIATARRNRSFTFSRPLAYAASFILVALAGSYFIGGLNIAQQDAVNKPAPQIASNVSPSTKPLVDSTVVASAGATTTGSADTGEPGSSPATTSVGHKTDRIASLPDGTGLAKSGSPAHSSVTATSGNAAVTGAASQPSSSSSSSSGVIASSSSPDNISKITASQGSGLSKPAEAEDLIADYGDPAVDGVYDFGISTNEDGLYAIKL